MPSPLGDLHDSTKKVLEPHHKRITEINQQMEALDQEKSMIKASAMHELQSTLKLNPELVGRTVAACR